MPAAAAPCLPLLPSTITPTRNSSTDYVNKKPPPVLNTLMNASCRGRVRRSVACNSSSSGTSSSSSGGCDITEFDLYELMGIDSGCDRSQIKTAYRTLQKRCHPDIAGPAGHDMAIILNEAYALLSDPNSRAAYDKEQAKVAQLRGYSGKPIYSVWFGSESEERAVFVDEVKCIGCLKCALCAENTFAIESVYGRARVVGQWADPESKIQEAIQACPVDCISIVERSNLAALEFLMSKQPRGSVRIGMGNTAGTRVSNIFVDVKKFQTSFQAAQDKASSAQSSNETDLQRQARLSAIQAIRSISNWLYWKTPTSSDQSTSLKKLIGHKSKEPDLGKLRDAAAARKQATNYQSSRPIRLLRPRLTNEEDYWMPAAAAAAAVSSSTQNNNYNSSIRSGSAFADQQRNNVGKDSRSVQYHEKIKKDQRNADPIRLLAPMGPAILMAAVVSRFNLQGDGGAVGNTNGGLKEHIYGSLALEIVNSSWLQIILVGITWYIIGTVLVGFVDAIKSRDGN